MFTNLVPLGHHLISHQIPAITHHVVIELFKCPWNLDWLVVYLPL